MALLLSRNAWSIEAPIIVGYRLIKVQDLTEQKMRG